MFEGVYEKDIDLTCFTQKLDDLIGLFAGVAALLFRKFRLYEYVRKVAPDGKSYTPIFRGWIALLIIIVIAWLAIALGNYVTELFFP